MSASSTAGTTDNLWRFTIRFAGPYWGWYAIGFAALVLTNLATLIIPQLTKSIVNVIAAEGDLSQYQRTAIIIIGLGLLMIIVRALSRIFVFWPGRKLEADVKSHLFDRMMRLPQRFFDQHGMGDLISRIANDTGQIRVFYAFGVLQVLNVACLLVFTLTMMISIHATLTALAIAPLVLMFFITRYTIPYMHKYSMANQAAIGRLTNRVTEAFVNVHTVQANAAEHTFIDRSSQENEAVYDTNMKLVVIRTLVFPLMSCLAGLSQLAVLFYGGKEAMAGRITVGDILAFNVYIGLLTFPLTAIGIIISVYQRAKTALERINIVETAEIEEDGLEGIAAAPEPNGEAVPVLSVRNLSYGFTAESGDQQFELQDISFDIRPGERVGIFGPIGSGKSCLFNLITRIYDPPPGAVLVNGHDIAQLKTDDLRHEVGYALQTVHLFSATVAENLAFGIEPPPPQAELDQAAEAACILEEVLAFDDGWQTPIGERGIRLSGGQKQRLALARMFLRQPNLMVLDDVLSAVDQSTEQRLIHNIYATKKALLIASHRGTALRDCDKILILRDGAIVDQGSFEELVPRHPLLASDD